MISFSSRLNASCFCRFLPSFIPRRSPSKGGSSDHVPDGNETDRLRRAIELTQEARRCADDPTQYDTAEQLLAEALALAPDNDTIVQNYVGFCREIGTYHLTDGADDAAIRYFTRVLTHTPNDGETWLDLGTACARGNHVREALQAWQQALKHLPDDAGNEEDIGAIAENIATVARALKVTINTGSTRQNVQKAIQRILKTLE